MRLTMLTTSFPRSSEDDASIFIRRIAEALSAKEAGGNIIVPLDSREPETEHIGLFEIRRYRYGIFSKGKLAFGSGIMPNLRANPFLVLQVPLFLLAMAYHGFRLSRKTDLIHAQWLASGIAAWLIHLATGKPYVVSLLGEDAKLIKLKALSPLWHLVLRAAAAVTAVNSQVLEEIQTRFSISKERCFHISTGVSIPSVSQEQVSEVLRKYNLSFTAPFLLAVARVIPLKGIHHALNIIGEPALKDIYLVVAGGKDDLSYYETLEKLADELGIRERVHFIGRVSPNDIPALLYGAAGFVSASSYEGRPNAVMESLAAGCLTIVSDIAPHRELVRDQENGLLVNVEDSISTAKRIQDTLTNPALLTAIQQNAKTSMAENSWDACASALISAYHFSIKI
jgi:glycosyltransferase involved in cell wall biosynthesis